MTSLKPLMLPCVLAVIGCARVPGNVDVRGQVTLDGAPVAGALVTFIPTGPPGRPARAITENDGAFRLETFGQNGITPGDYRIAVAERMELKPGQKTVNTVLTPAFDVSRSKKAKEKLESRRAAAERAHVQKGGLPSRYSNSQTTPLHCKIPPPNGEVLLELTSEQNPPPKK